MREVQDVYISYQLARARYMNRGYRIPKDWDKVWSKISEKELYNLENITKAFSTRWQNIDIDRYFDCGFFLFNKGFNYSKFYDRRILLKYIEDDKRIKRRVDGISEGLINSDEWIYNWMDSRGYNRDISIYVQYCRMVDDGLRAPIYHYLMNKIDCSMLAWLISRKYIELSDIERGLIPIVISQYWDLVNSINKLGYKGRENNE